MSSTVTEGIRVTVTSRYVAEQSDPMSGRFVFGYTVRIGNESARTVQLQARHWVITDGDGRVREVAGPGVVGHQPVLRPGQTFEYTSGAVLPTQRGTMHGSYQMVREDGTGFDAEIALFVLELPHSLN